VPVALTVKLVLPPEHIVLVEGWPVILGAVQLLQLKLQASGSVNGVASFVFQFAGLKIAARRFEGEFEVTEQL
jgi:hypothetical protein